MRTLGSHTVHGPSKGSAKVSILFYQVTIDFRFRPPSCDQRPKPYKAEWLLGGYLKKKFFEIPVPPSRGLGLGRKFFFRFFQKLCGAFYLGPDPNSCRIEIFDQKREAKPAFIWKRPFGASFGLQVDSVSNFSPQGETFFSDIFLPFCRGEKVTQHMWKSAWVELTWLRDSRCTVKIGRFLL